MTDEPTPHQLSARIARLEGELKASRAENDAMESRIDARLAGMQADMATHREDAAKRETRLILAMAGMIGLAVAILKFG